MGPGRAIARRALADARVRTGSFALLFALYVYANAVGYRSSYPTLSERLAFAHSFGSNKAIELFYGTPHDLLTVGGYCAWRVAGFGAIVAGLFGVLAAVRALRAEEDAGRQELVLAGAVSRGSAYVSALAAIGAGTGILWLALFLGSVAGHLSAGGSAYLALATISPVPVFVGVGALASQLAPTRRLALELGSAVLALAFLLRVVADTSSGLGSLRWATPLGWTEELRPFTGPRPGALIPLLVAAAGLLVLAGRLAARRDVGTGVLRGRDSAPARLRLLSSPIAQALRAERGSLAGWLVGAGLYALLIGLLSTSFSSKDISGNLQREIDKLGGASITTPAGALGVYFLFFVLAISLFACSQVAAARHEEADSLLETLLAQPVGRHRWLGGRLLLAAAGATVLALAAGALAWLGAASQHAGIGLPRMLETGANCLPTALLFLGLAALAYAVAPRASSGIAYALVGIAFVWQLVGALLGAPHWLLELTPFQHVGLVPAQPFRAEAAAIMLAIAAVTVLAAHALFRRRDLVSG